MSFSLGSIQRKLLGPIIPIIRTQGLINDGAVSRLEKSLQMFSPQRAQAIALVINSPGGQIARCQEIVDTLKIFTKKHDLPLYTFGDCIVCSGGYFLLAVGDKVYADKTSWVGSIGTVSQYTNAKGLLKKYNIDVRTWRSNDDLVLPLFDHFASVEKDSTKENLVKINEYLHQGFIEHVEAHREKKITVANDQRLEKLYQGEIWSGNEAAKLGLIDDVGNYPDVLAREFPDANLVEVTTTTTIEQLRERWALSVEMMENFSENAILSKFKKAFGATQTK